MFKNYFILFIFLSLIFSSCILNNEMNQNGNIIIQTPEYLQADKLITRSISGFDSTQTLSGYVQNNQSKIRYEISVESNGKKITSLIMKNNKISSLAVPSGIRLDIAIGIFLAQDENTNNELWNAYLASDVKRDITLQPNETRMFEFTVDLTKQSKVNTYYTVPGIAATDNSPGMNDVISGTNLPSGQPFFFIY